jgi:endonuclease/exonuclease/phosphatase (EEP) superfamily protein YafD
MPPKPRTTPKSKPKPKRRLSWLRPFVWLNAFGVIALAVSNHFVAERYWPTMLLAFLPSAIFLFPTILLFAIILFKRRWLLLPLNAAALVIGIIGVGGFRWHPQKPTPKDSIRLLTFNVQHGAQGWARVASAIRHASPDIVCLQEADVKALRKLLPAYQFASLSGEVIGTTGQIVKSNGEPLPDGEGRTVLGATILTHGQRVHVVTTHCAPLDYGILGKLNPAEIQRHLATLANRQDQQADKILDFIKPIDGPLVMCGDFNGPPLGRRYEKLTASLADAWEQAGQGFGYTMPSGFPLLRVDWVLVNSKVKVASIAPLAEIAADHRGVIVDFQVRP